MVYSKKVSRGGSIILQRAVSMLVKAQIRSVSATGLPFKQILSLKCSRCGEVKVATRRPVCRASCCNSATQVPLPLVPTTLMSVARRMRSLSCCIMRCIGLRVGSGRSTLILLGLDG